MKFFKSTWFKCIAVLLSRAVVLGGLLAILNDLLYVSPEERTGRAFEKIYGRTLSPNEYITKLDVDSTNPDVEKQPKEYPIPADFITKKRISIFGYPLLF